MDHRIGYELVSKLFFVWGSMGIDQQINAASVILSLLSSENSLKNRFYGILRKIMRKIEKVIRIKKMKQSKALKLRTLIEVLERGKKPERCERANGISFQDQEDLSG